MKYKLDPLSPSGISPVQPTQGYNPYFAGGPGKVSLLDSVNGKHGAVQIVAGDNVTIDNTGKDTISIAAAAGGEASISDAAYGVGWNGDTTTAPSKNAVYDKIETLVGGGVSESLAIAYSVAL